MDSVEKNNSDGANNREIKEAEQSITEPYVITAYCPCVKCCGKTDGITATGTKATQGKTIAVDPSKIPYGSEIEIEGVGVRIAEDCGGAIKGNKIDLYFGTHEQALEWGRQTKQVTIIN